MPRTKRVINNANTTKKSKKVKKNGKINTKNEMINNALTDNESVTSDLNNSKNDTIDKKIMNCVKNCKIFDDATNQSSNKYKSRYPTEKDYQNSFDDIISFSKSFTKKEMTDIDVIMYNENNNDGMISAYIAWLFFKETNSAKSPLFIPAKPSSSNNILNMRLKKHEYNLRGKTVLIVDISFGKANYQYLTSICKQIIIVDDHKIVTNNNIGKYINKFNNVKHFIGDTHSACSYVWKFFFPKKDVPYYIMVIDNKDKKLYLPFIPRLKSQYFTSYLSFRITSNPYLNKDDPHYFDKVHELLDVDSNFSSLVGKFYDEVENNIKDQVAKNARKTYFQGHPVYVLNYSDPVLYKKVARQMVTNAEKKGDHIDFAVIWGYEYTAGAYKVFLSEKHEGRPKFNLPDMARKLGKIGGTARAGFGKEFIGNFYWPKNNNHDIWDLFSKKYV
jgi:hypothetical protein